MSAHRKTRQQKESELAISIRNSTKPKRNGERKMALLRLLTGLQALALLVLAVVLSDDASTVVGAAEYRRHTNNWAVVVRA